MPSSTLPGLCLLLLAAPVTAQPAPPRTPELVASNSYAFAYTATTLSGAGADLLRRELADTQFVLFGEDHMDHATPVFAGALFRMLHESHGFRHLVVEQDPVAIEEALEPERRGDVERLAGLAKLYPSLFEFDSDEDLGLLAEVAAISEGPDAIWGVEQATGAVRYLEELVDLAPDRDARARAQLLLRDAQAADPGPRYSVNWLAAPATPAAIEALAQRFHADAGSRAARLIAGLAKSAEVFGYYRRAEAGEFVGLYNNTEREAVLKRGFLQRYQAVARTAAPPKAMFKFGANHMYHGKNPSQAFPIGNLAHELAIANGSRAFGIYVIALGDGYRSYADYPAWLLSLLPATQPKVATIVDLRPLRPYQRLFREKVDPADLWQQRALLHGFEAIVLLPGSRPAARRLGGRD
jgi:hypothetical protein